MNVRANDVRIAFAEVIKRWNQPGRLLTLTYSTVGLRGDCDMVLWRICYTPEDLNQMTAELMATPMGGYLQTAYSFLSMTKRSQYLIGHEHEGQHVLIYGRKHFGCFPTQDGALEKGFRWFGRVAFLGKKIRHDEEPRPLVWTIL